MTRKYNIDLLRIISTVAVVIIHIVSSPVYNSTKTIDLSLKNNLALIHTLMLWSVPIFFMITGYCLLMKEECTYKYCFSHVIKYVGVLFTVGLFYSFLEEIFIAKSLNITVIIKSVLNVVNGNLWDHMWFIYSIIGIYLVMPVIHNFMQQGKENIFILSILLFFFTIIAPSIEKWIHIGIDFPFGGYLFYVCFGGAVAKCKIRKSLLYLLIFFGILSVVYVIINNVDHIWRYRDLAIALIAMCFFLLFNTITIKPNKYILEISKCTWGIYLIHPFFINIVIKLLKIDLLTTLPYVKLFIFSVIVLLFSFVMTYILRKLPVVKSLF